MSVDPDEAGAQAGASASVPHIQVILGSTRNGRLGDRVAAWFMGHASVRRDLTAELVDLRDRPLPFFDEPTPPIRGGYANPAQRAWAAKVEAADGYVFVSPEYNHGYTAVLKNALDHLYAEWTYKPAGFVGYGGLGGGIRAVEQLRQVVVELAMVPVREQVVIPAAHRVFGSDGPVDESLGRSADSLLSEVARWATITRGSPLR